MAVYLYRVYDNKCQMAVDVKAIRSFGFGNQSMAVEQSIAVEQSMGDNKSEKRYRRRCEKDIMM